MCFVGNCNASKRNLTFVSGILFVLAGKWFQLSDTIRSLDPRRGKKALEQFLSSHSFSAHVWPLSKATCLVP